MNSGTTRTFIPRNLAVGCVILFWLIYTILQTLSVLETIGEIPYAFLGFIPGLLGVGVLLFAGISSQDCFLTLKPISTKGFLVLVAIAIFALSAMLPFGVWQGWSWMAALVFAPMSGISQELFFRSALLPAMRSILKNKPFIALLFHSVLFGLWHIGPLFMGAPIGAVIAIMLVPFISGLGWGWQVVRDRTVIWAMIQHSLIWVIGNQFAYTA
jgi:membrane protease YdiL (CAAX protease family)